MNKKKLSPASETKIWPAGKKEMSKYGYCVVQVSGSIEHKAGYTCYNVLDYKPASLVGSYSPGFVCRASTPEGAIATAKELEEIDIDMPRAWRACRIWMARKGLKKSKGVQTNALAPTTPPECLPEAPEVQEAQEAPEAPATEDYVTELVDSLISESDIKPQPFSMIKIVESPTLKKWIIFNTLNVEDYYRVVKIAEPYITEICKEWLTNFGTWTAPKHFPKESHIEVSDLYDTKQVLKYIRAKLLVH